MTRYDVTAPVEGYNGEVGGVRFYKGRAVVDGDTHGAAVAYMRRRGYTLTPINEVEAESSEEQAPEPKRPGANDPKAMWVRYAVLATGLSEAEANDLTKAELQELADTKEQQS